jgi:hypothetical protein
MDPGIGAARRVRYHRAPAQAREHRLERPLHRAALGLALPAGEVGAVELEPHQDRTFHYSEI